MHHYVIKRENMKILYDHQAFSMQDYGGVSRYFTELMNQFYLNKQLLFELSLRYSNNSNLRNKSFSNHCNFLKGFNFTGKGPLLSQINKLFTIKRIKKTDFDIFHPTYYDPYFLKYTKKPFVLTIFDMIHEIYPEYFPWYNRIHANKCLLAERAEKIIAISKNTKKDIVKFLKIDPEKIDVIYLGNSISGNIKKNIPEIHEPLSNSKYLLFVGNRENYKNFRFFVSSILPLFESDKEIRLICAGGGDFSDEEKQFIDRFSLQNRVIQVPVNDSLLGELYSHALTFVFPSLYEGFGIPVLEAFSRKCPVICSNSSSLPEVGGDAARYFNPENQDSIMETISRVINDENIRNRMKEEGLARLNYFSWHKTADDTNDLYSRILNS
jgi:glycosyltransferase involved in cell wall biosynthesis